GDKDADANLLIGMRASLSIHTSDDMLVRGNYIHTEIPSYRWSQVHSLAVVSPCPGLVVEHNVLRHGQWVVRGLTGEFRPTVRPGFTEKKTLPGPPRLGYADYNLFYNPDAAERCNYALSVPGKTERVDAGFGRHDVPAGGAKDAQVGPKFKGPIPSRFPFAD